MARKLKTYLTSMDFFDLAIAAPSMKAALGAWGAGSNLFHQGRAKESNDPEVVEATMSKPGVVLKRPVGSTGKFKEEAELPSHLSDRRPHPKKQASRKAKSAGDNEAATEKAALTCEREEKKREQQRRREQEKQDRRQRAIDKAKAAIEGAERIMKKKCALSKPNGPNWKRGRTLRMLTLKN